MFLLDGDLLESVLEAIFRGLFETALKHVLVELFEQKLSKFRSLFLRGQTRFLLGISNHFLQIRKIKN